MKKRLAVLICALVLLILTACEASTTQTAEPSPTPTVEATPTPSPLPTPTLTSTPAPTDESELPEPPELLYQTETVYAPETTTRRTTLDPQGLNLSVYYEIPVFTGTEAGYPKINAFLESLRDDFFTPGNDDLTSAWEYASWSHETPYQYEVTGIIDTKSEKLVSVSMDYYWWMGGVQDYGGDSYTFRTDTGELLRLTDLLDGTEEELKGMILQATKDQTAEVDRGSDPGRIENYSLDQFEFFVEQDKVWIRFDKYEIAHGAAGQFFIELPAELKVEWID